MDNKTKSGSGSNIAGGDAAAAKSGDGPVGPSGPVMKAPGSDEYISREAFEKNPQGYFSNLHSDQKAKK